MVLLCAGWEDKRVDIFFPVWPTAVNIFYYRRVASVIVIEAEEAL